MLILTWMYTMSMMTMLFTWLPKGHLSITKLLLAAGADTSQAVLDLALAGNHHDVCRLLLIQFTWALNCGTSHTIRDKTLTTYPPDSAPDTASATDILCYWIWRHSVISDKCFSSSFVNLSPSSTCSFTNWYTQALRIAWLEWGTKRWKLAVTLAVPAN